MVFVELLLTLTLEPILISLEFPVGTPESLLEHLLETQLKIMVDFLRNSDWNRVRISVGIPSCTPVGLSA